MSPGARRGRGRPSGIGAGLSVVFVLLVFTTPSLAGAPPPSLLPDFVEERRWPSVLATDVAEASGLDFMHAPFRDGRPSHRESTMGGACWGDADRDGRMDLYITDSIGPDDEGLSRLYRNMGPDASGHVAFEDVTEVTGVGVHGVAQGCVWGDYDNDGDQDLFVAVSPTTYSATTNRLFRNDDGAFVDVSDVAGIEGDTDHPDSTLACRPLLETGEGLVPSCWSVGGAWLDHDGDGDLDLYVVNYGESPSGACTGGYGVNPGLCLGQGNRLYRNDGDGTFTEVGEALGVAVNGEATRGRSLGVIATDIDGDAWPDLYVASDLDANALYLNDGRGDFRSLARVYGVDGVGPRLVGSDGHRGGMGVDAADYDDDGRVDLLSTHLPNQFDAVYRSIDVGWTEVGRKSDALTEVAGMVSRWGGGFFDFDLDGRKDLLMVHGHQYDGTPGPVSLMWNDHGDFRLVGPPFWAYGNESERMWRDHRAAAFADYDDDGDLDVFAGALAATDGDKAAEEGRPRLFRFNTIRADSVTRSTAEEAIDAPHWLRVTLVGTDGPRDGVGARVRVTTDDGRSQWLWRDSGGSYLGDNDPRLLFGLGGRARGELEVVWPTKADEPQRLAFDLAGRKGLALVIEEPDTRPPAAVGWRSLPEDVGEGLLRLSWNTTFATDFSAYVLEWGAGGEVVGSERLEDRATGTVDRARPDAAEWVRLRIEDLGGHVSEPSMAFDLRSAPGAVAAVPAPLLVTALTAVVVFAALRRRW
ncbi:MAG: CRTAC1 family protein [Euryarchaeota archaeon]|nr:CRTAC1 family protein [Euryarchaeota archaeon]